LDENTVSQAFSKERMKMIKSILGGANNWMSSQWEYKLLTKSYMNNISLNH
jgi:hypothetical protein